MRNVSYITTPIFYPNAKPHLGHAYTATLADIFARHRRLSGDEVYLLTGVDENTEKVVRAAIAVGQDTKSYLDGVVSAFTDLFSAQKLNISYDQFIRTSNEKVHWPGAQAMWQKLVDAGDIYPASYDGFYCVGHEAFVTEKDLIDGKCPDHNEAPEHLKETNYFFRLSKYTDEIKKRIESNELEIIPAARKNEILALLEQGLQDVSFSRPTGKVSVGIPVPGDSTQKMYVWCDALTNYISALGYGRDDWLFRKFWYDGADTLHIIGKDILRFHAGIWPGMLLSAGLPLPKKILVHGFITSGGKKMSKTLGNVIDPDVLIAEYGGEAVRYFLARHISPFEDGDITLEMFKNAYNADLANGLGNLVSRIMKMAEEHHHPASPIRHPTERLFSRAGPSSTEEGILESYNIQAYAEYISQEIARLDRRIQETEPFKLVKKDKTAAQKIIAELVNKLSHIASLLQPILPTTAVKIHDAITQNRMPEKPLFPRK
ncbi:MAG: methionyl-tRNA synthetase [Parcubacteria group bacterium Gr01-1014_17]|nr:MAG: methionyl-tRNA synthetase [Parcubacteria group bacterium Gr01-1014_17]